MKKFNFFHFYIFLQVCSIIASVKSERHIKIHNIDMHMDENPYLNKDGWAFLVETGGEVLTVKCPVKAELPEDMMLTFKITGEKIAPFNHQVNLCEAFDDEVFAKDIMAHGYPPKTFPKSCVVLPGNNYVLKRYPLPADKLLPGTPDGLFAADVLMHLPGQEPIMEITINGEVSGGIAGGI